MTPTDKKDTYEQRDLYDTDASQPEVLYDEEADYETDEMPSQAKGEREIVEENLEDKSNSRE